MGVLEKAMQLANQDPDAVGDDDDEEEGHSAAAKVGERVVLMWFSSEMIEIINLCPAN